MADDQYVDRLAETTANTALNETAASAAAGIGSSQALANLNSTIAQLVTVTRKQTQATAAQTQQSRRTASGRGGGGGRGRGGGGSGGGGGGGAGGGNLFPNRGPNGRANAGRGGRTRGPGAALGFVAASALGNIGAQDAGSILSQGIHGFNAGAEAFGSVRGGVAGAVIAGGAAIVGQIRREQQATLRANAEREISGTSIYSAGSSSARAIRTVRADAAERRAGFGREFLDTLAGRDSRAEEALAVAEIQNDATFQAQDLLEAQLKSTRVRLSSDQLRALSEINERRVNNMRANLDLARDNGLIFDGRGRKN